MFNIQTTKRATPQIVKTWAAGVTAAGGGFESNSMVIASNLAKLLQSKSYYTKIKYLLPLLGRGINAARVPLIDTVNSGTATNNNFLDADFSQSAGLTGNGSTKRFDLGFTAAVLGSSQNGGLGVWVLAYSGTGGHIIGERNADLFMMALVVGGSPERTFFWSPGFISNSAATPGTSHYYSQRNSTNLIMYESGSSILTSTNGGSSSNLASSNINFMAIDGSFLFNGTTGVGYCTDGTLTSAEAYDLHQALLRGLMVPTGRV